MIKKLSFLFLALFFISALLYAHCGKCGVGKAATKTEKGACLSKCDMENPTPEMREKMRAEYLEMLSKEVSLTGDQKTQISDIMKSSCDKIADKKEALKKEIDSIMQQTQDDIKSKLTEDQKPKFDAFMQKIKEGKCDSCGKSKKYIKKKSNK